MSCYFTFEYLQKLLLMVEKYRSGLSENRLKIISQYNQVMVRDGKYNEIISYFCTIIIVVFDNTIILCRLIEKNLILKTNC